MLELQAVTTHLLQGRKMRERWAAANHKAIYGEAVDCNVGDDEVGSMVLGDNIVNNQRSNPWITTAVVAAMLLGGGGLGGFLLSRQPAAVDRVITNSEQVEVLAPIIRSPRSDS